MRFKDKLKRNEKRKVNLGIMGKNYRLKSLVLQATSCNSENPIKPINFAQKSSFFVDYGNLQAYLSRFWNSHKQKYSLKTCKIFTEKSQTLLR